MTVKQKRWAAGLGAAVMLGTALGGCAGPGENAEGKDSLKLTWWTLNNQPAYITSYNDIEAFQKMQERSGIQIEFIHPAKEQGPEQFNVMISSKDYPDIIDWRWEKEYPGGMNKAAEDGVIIKLNDYMKYAPNYSKLLEEKPDIEKSIKTTDGSILTFNSLKDDLEINSYFGPCIRKDWLERLGLAVPQTVEEWHTVLKAIKTGDPNGNGKEDEIPLVDDQFHTVQYLSAAWGVLKGQFYEKDGKMVYGSVQPGYRDFLQTMNAWYQEGLIDSEFASSGRTNTDAKALGDTAGAFVGFMGSQMGTYLTVKKDMDLVGAPWPKGPEGKSYIGMPDMLKMVEPGYGTAISTANKHVKETVGFLDYSYSSEGIVLHNWGKEGETYQKTEDGYQLTDFVLQNPDGKNPIEVMGRYALTTMGGFGKVMNGPAYTALMQTFSQQKEASKLWTQGDTSLLLPPFPMTAEESLRVSSIMAEALLYEDEMYTKMIMGIEPISKFDEYVEHMRAIGVDEAVQLYETAYARYLAQQ